MAVRGRRGDTSRVSEMGCWVLVLGVDAVLTVVCECLRACLELRCAAAVRVRFGADRAEAVAGEGRG